MEFEIDPKEALRLAAALLRRAVYPALRDARAAVAALGHADRKERLTTILDTLDQEFTALEREVTRK